MDEDYELDFDSLSNDDLVLVSALIEYALLTAELPLDVTLQGFGHLTELIRAEQGIQIEPASAEHLNDGILSFGSHLTDLQTIGVVRVAA